MQTIEYCLDGFNISLPHNHALPSIRKIYPLYSSNIARIAKSIFIKYPDMTIIDIGANIGDSVAIMRSLCQSPILCIEGCNEYIPFLKINSSQFNNIEIDENYIGDPNLASSYNVIVEKGSAHIINNSDNALINICSFNQILQRHPAFQNAKFWKIDTDGYDTSIIKQGLAEIKGSYPIIHFEYDPYFLDLSGNMNLDIFHVLRSYRYHYALFYENTGDFFAMIDICNETLLEDLHQAQCGRKSERYWDICVFPEEDTDICISLRKSEISLFKKARADKPKRLLWVRTDAIGDNILAASELEHLKKHYGGAEIIVLCQNRVADIYAACPFVDHLITFDRIRALSDEVYRKCILDEVIELKPDISLNSVYSREPLTDYFAIECGAKEKIAIDCNLSNISNELREKHNRFYTHVIPSNGEHKSEIERHADFLRGLGIENPALEVNLWISQEDEHYAQELFRKYDMIPERTIALFAGAHGAHKLSDAYGEAIDEVCKDGNYTIIALGASQDADIISRNLRKINIPYINLCGQTNLRQSAAILAQCRLGIGADTGLAHMCCGVGTPNVVLLGGAHFGRFMPYSPLTSIACLPLDCYGCDWQCRYSRAYCVQDVTSNVLKEALRETLAHKSDRPRVFIQPESLWCAPMNGPRWRMLTQSEIPVNCELIVTENPEKEPLKNELSPIRVSAIVSTYKSERFMRGCLEDLVSQTLYKKGGLEIIVIDACSPENEAAIVKEFQAKYENIRYIRTDERVPLYLAWNIGIKNACGEYISNANTDDRHAPEMLERLADELDRRPDIGLVYADCLITKTENATFDNPNAVSIYQWLDHSHEQLLKGCYIGPQPVWRRSLHDIYGYFDEDYISAGDYEFWLRLSAAGVNFLHIPQTLGLYLENPASISLGYSNISWEESEKARCKYKYGLNERSAIAPQLHSEKVSVSANEQNDLPPPFPRKVLLMCDYFWPSVGGVELYVQDLGMHLMQAGYHVEIGARWLSSRDTNEYQGMCIHSFKCDGSHGEGNVCLENERYRKVIMQGGYDAVFALTQPDNWVAKGLLNLPEGHPRIYLMPSINQQNITEWNSHGSLIDMLNTLRSMDGLISVTENGLDAKVIQAAHLSSVFIPHAVEYDAVSQNFREAFNLDMKRPLLVMVANYWPVKNHLELLQTLDGIDGDWQLIIIGNPINHFPDYHKQVLIQAAKDPRVRIMGGFPREIAASAIRDADILLVPSKGESAGPLVVLQAMSYGTPWIATPECNGVSDEAGGIVTPLSQFPTEIKALLAAPEVRSEIGELGREHWKACFTWAKSLPAFVDLIENRQISSSLTMPADIRVRNTQAIKKLHENSYSDVTRVPMFSIIIPTYNRSDNLLKNLDALAKQSYPFDRFEVIVCDDGSTDDTQSALSIYSAPYDLIILHQDNKGAAAARNNAIKHAKGDYLLILNDDVIAENDLIEQHLKEHQKHNNMKISVLGDVCTMPKYSERLISQVLERKHLLFPQANKQEGVEYDHNMFVTANISIRRSLFTEDGFWFDENFPRCMCEDIELGYRLYKHGVKMFYQPAAKVMHDHCLTVADYIRREKDNSSNLLYFISKHPELIPMYLGVDKLSDDVLSQWKQHLETIKADVPNLIEHIEVIQEKSINQLSGSAQDSEIILEQVYQALCVIKEYITATNIIQLVEKNSNLYQKLKLGYNPQYNNKCDNSEIQITSESIKYQQGLTSIIILNINGGAYTQSCIESIRRHTNSPYEIIVVDNGSTDENKNHLRSMSDITLIENNENVGAPLGRNQGLSIAKGEYIVFLDNDTIVTEGWIDRFISHFRRDHTLGAIGPRSNFAANSQLVNDPVYDDWGELDNFATKWSLNHNGQLTYTSRLILFCIIIKRELVEIIGGIDPIYEKWGWEDDDLCIRIQIARYRLGIADDVYIHHFGNQTSVSANIDYNELFRHNWDIFRNKWNIPWISSQPIKYNELELIKTHYDPRKHRISIPARQDVERLIYRHNADEIPSWKYKLRKQMVFEYMNKQSWKEAVQLASECLSEHPDDWELKHALSVALLNTGDREGAKELMREGTENAPDKHNFSRNLASTLLEEGDTMNALEYVLQAVST